MKTTSVQATLARMLFLSLPALAAAYSPPRRRRIRGQRRPRPASISTSWNASTRTTTGFCRRASSPRSRRGGSAPPMSITTGAITPTELHSFGVARRAARFARADRNNDQKLEPSEVGPIRWDYLRVADADRDGTVTLDEVERAVASGTLKGMSAEEVFQLLDRNGDGVIDLTRAPARERALLAPADTDHDSKVTLEELKAYRIAVGRD